MTTLTSGKRERKRNDKHETTNNFTYTDVVDVEIESDEYYSSLSTIVDRKIEYSIFLFKIFNWISKRGTTTTTKRIPF